MLAYRHSLTSADVDRGCFCDLFSGLFQGMINLLAETAAAAADAEMRDAAATDKTKVTKCFRFIYSSYDNVSRYDIVSLMADAVLTMRVGRWGTSRIFLLLDRVVLQRIYSKVNTLCDRLFPAGNEKKSL
jgi:hypothetical protein